MEKSNNLLITKNSYKKMLKKENIDFFKNILKFILFDIFVLSIFFVSDYKILLCIFLLNVVFFMCLKLKVIHLFRYLLYITPIIILTFLINIFLMNILYALLISTRFVLACVSTYIFSKTVTVLEISKVIETLLSPLKILKFDVKSVGLLVSIAISFIPIIKDELVELRQVLMSKGYIMKINNIHIFIRPLVISIFKRTNDIEKSIISKGYNEI